MAITKRESEMSEGKLTEFKKRYVAAGASLDEHIRPLPKGRAAYVLITVEAVPEEVDGKEVYPAVTSAEATFKVGLQVNGNGFLLANGFASFLTREEYSGIVRQANIIAANIDDGSESESPFDDFLRSLFTGE